MDTEIKNFRRRLEQKFGKVVGLGSSGLQKVLSSLQEVGNLPTRVYCLSKYCFGFGWALRAVWIVFPDTKMDFFFFFFFLVLSYDDQFFFFLGSFEADFWTEFRKGFVPCL